MNNIFARHNFIVPSSFLFSFQAHFCSSHFFLHIHFYNNDWLTTSCNMHFAWSIKAQHTKCTHTRPPYDRDRPNHKSTHSIEALVVALVHVIYRSMIFSMQIWSQFFLEWLMRIKFQLWTAVELVFYMFFPLIFFFTVTFRHITWGATNIWEWGRCVARMQFDHFHFLSIGYFSIWNLLENAGAWADPFATLSTFMNYGDLRYL